MIENKIIERLEGRLDNVAVVTPKAYFTADDKSNGYSVTLDLIAEYGLEYTCDLYHDDQPTDIHVASGQLTAIPYSLEVNDHYGFFIYNMSPREYAQTLIRQFDRLAAEGEKSGTVMCIPLHSYLIGQPHRIGPFEEVLRHIAADGRAWIARAGEIVDSYRAQTGGAA